MIEIKTASTIPLDTLQKELVMCSHFSKYKSHAQEDIYGILNISIEDTQIIYEDNTPIGYFIIKEIDNQLAIDTDPIYKLSTVGIKKDVNKFSLCEALYQIITKYYPGSFLIPEESTSVLYRFLVEKSKGKQYGHRKSSIVVIDGKNYIQVKYGQSMDTLKKIFKCSEAQAKDSIFRNFMDFIYPVERYNQGLELDKHNSYPFEVHLPVQRLSQEEEKHLYGLLATHNGPEKHSFRHWYSVRYMIAESIDYLLSYDREKILKSRSIYQLIEYANECITLHQNKVVSKPITQLDSFAIGNSNYVLEKIENREQAMEHIKNSDIKITRQTIRIKDFYTNLISKKTHYFILRDSDTLQRSLFQYIVEDGTFALCGSSKKLDQSFILDNEAVCRAIQSISSAGYSINNIIGPFPFKDCALVKIQNTNQFTLLREGTLEELIPQEISLVPRKIKSYGDDGETYSYNHKYSIYLSESPNPKDIYLLSLFPGIELVSGTSHLQ